MYIITLIRRIWIRVGMCCIIYYSISLGFVCVCVCVCVCNACVCVVCAMECVSE